MFTKTERKEITKYENGKITICVFDLNHVLKKDLKTKLGHRGLEFSIEFRI